MELEYYLSNESETQIAVATFDFLTWYDIKNAFVLRNRILSKNDKWNV